MLELKQLTKIYSSKGGAETIALNDVSVSFGETGLVFLLGKSGSGKSTMLNLAGGLDEPTHGEVVVMGKSSKDFSVSDFDSYRNTFVGFVFQEYNVLDEFTVEENVALALELQGTNDNGDRVKKILDEVELGGLEKRKPNTLSGGQKQRIAIARALVKEPKIILADEPTGALDSETGKQVFDTLKKLSETRLVIVVSHDREFAETYGDRIIELKDGRIISDLTKASDGEDGTAQRDVSLNEETFTKLCAFLENKGQDTSNGEKNLEEFLRANQIGGNGGKTFAPTKEQKLKEYNGDETQFIRSRLPAKKAFKIGASGLKLKPFRLVMTILLSVVSFILFGLASEMMLYDGNAVVRESLLSGEDEYLDVVKYYVTQRKDYGHEYTRWENTYFTPAEVKAFGEDAFGAYKSNITNFDNVQETYDQKNYSMPAIGKIAYLPEGHSLRNKLTAGTYPAAENEIAVSSYFLECLTCSDFYPEFNGKEVLGSPKAIKVAEDLIGEFINVNGTPVRVTGVFDSGKIPERFVSELKGNPDLSSYGWEVYNDFRSFLSDGLHCVAFVSEGFIKSYKNSNGSGVDYFNKCGNVFYFPSRQEDVYNLATSNIKVFNKNDKNRLPVLLIDESITELKSNQLILSAGVLSNYYSDMLSSDVYSIFDDARRILFDDPNDETAQKTIVEFMKAHPLFVTVLDDKDNTVGTFDIVGVWIYRDSGLNAIENIEGFYCSPNFYNNAMNGTETKYEREPDATYEYVVLPLERNEQSLGKLIEKMGVVDPNTDVVYQLDNSVYYTATFANEIVSELSIVFLWVGGVLAVFAALLLFNFISMSITNKRKEIGILRAVGARGIDVFKIFFAESGLIVSICTILAVLGTIALSAVLNNFILGEHVISVALFVFGPPSLLLMIGVAVAVALVATFLPVYLAARKKPVESIRAL